MDSFNTLIELALGTTAKLRILTILHKWHKTFLSERQLAELCQLSTYGIRHALGDLEMIRLLSKQVVGRAHIWSFNQESVAYEQLAPIITRITETKDPLTHIKDQLIGTLPLKQIDSMTLFGSLLEKSFYEAADIDICILLMPRSGVKVKKSIEELIAQLSADFLSSIGKSIDAYIFTEEEWNQMRRKPLRQAISKGQDIYNHGKV